MFNMLMSGGGWTPSRMAFGRGRTLEHTEEDLKTRFKPNGVLDLAAVSQLPCLFVAETQHDNSQDAAHVGTITRARFGGSDYNLEYTYDPDIPPIPNSVLRSMAGELGIEEFEFNRTHWAIKDVDLFRVLLKQGLGRRNQPKVFTLSDEPVDESLVAVMMPFDSAFAPAYAALKGAIQAAGMTCQRADDIWEHDHVIQDVVSLICKASIVVCDLSGRNANVFYETGIAHTLGRDVIMIAQTPGDVPFDVAAIRYIRYLNNGEGFAKLTVEVQRRIGTLRARRT